MRDESAYTLDEAGDPERAHVVPWLCKKTPKNGGIIIVGYRGENDG